MAKNAGILSRETLERVARIIHDEAIADRECQVSKRALTEHNKDFCALNAFKRIDADGKGWINSLDLVQLFQENGKVIPEMDTYMLVNAFDSNDDGRLSLMDISKLLSPVSYYGSQNLKATKNTFRYGIENHRVKLSYDIEHGIIRICEREIASVNAVETLKQELLSYNDYSSLEIFRAIDQYAHGNINCDNLRCFFLNFPFCSALSENDLKNWIRRYDRDVDGKLDYADFVRGLGPYCNYSQKAQLVSAEDEPASQIKKPSPVEPIQGYDLIDAAKSEQQMPAYEKAGSIAGRSGYTKSTAISYRKDGVAVSEQLPRTKKFLSPSRIGAVSKATQPVGKFGKGAKDMIIQ